ncbi:MAG: hypothetical protein DVB27_12965 [Verrucomicrobia bacterium]|nr:MAG: hypothetical protein DVB27_12965 [Verrucomicrobiota bacterium]
MQHHATKGIYLKHGVYWLAGRMVRGVRRPHISLQTTELVEAINRAAKIRAAPELNPSAGLAGEVEAFLAAKLKAKTYARSGG